MKLKKYFLKIVILTTSIWGINTVYANNHPHNENNHGKLTTSSNAHSGEHHNGKTAQQHFEKEGHKGKSEKAHDGYSNPTHGYSNSTHDYSNTTHSEGHHIDKPNHPNFGGEGHHGVPEMNGPRGQWDAMRTNN